MQSFKQYLRRGCWGGVQGRGCEGRWCEEAGGEGRGGEGSMMWMCGNVWDAESGISGGGGVGGGRSLLNVQKRGRGYIFLYFFLHIPHTLID